MTHFKDQEKNLNVIKFGIFLKKIG